MRGIVAAILGWLVAFGAFDHAIASGEQRVALVIGNNSYPKLKTAREPENGQLAKAIPDAETMSDTLRALGFDVDLVRDADRTDLLTAIDRLKRRTQPGATVFVFYAGHGVALKGSNLLLPSDMPPVDPDSEHLVRGLAIAETDIIEAVRDKGAGLIILALDACRDNPIEEFAKKQAQSQGRAFRSTSMMRSTGLEARPATGVFSIYSAGYGQRALDSAPASGRNSVFTHVFAKHLKEPGRHLSDIMEDVKQEVASIAATVIDPESNRPHRQFPAFYNETQGGRIFLAGLPHVDSSPEPAPKRKDSLAFDEVTWDFIKDSDDVETLRRFLRQFPDSARRKDAELKITALAPAQKHVDQPALDVKSSPPLPALDAATVSATREKYRGWMLTPQSGHGRDILTARISLDGRYIVSGSEDDTLKLWEAESGRLIRNFRGHSDAVNSAAFSPDGRRIVSGSRDKTLRLWDAETGRLIRTFEGHSGDVRSVAFAPDGRRIVSGAYDNTVRLWEADTGRLIRAFKTQSIVHCVAFAPDGGRIVSGSFDSSLRLWDAGSGRLIRTFAAHFDTVTSVSFSPDGRRIVSGSADKTIRLWAADSGRLIRTFEGHSGPVQSVAFAPDGQRIVSGSYDAVKLWEADSDRLIQTFEGNTVNSVEFARDGRHILSGGQTINMWEADGGRLVRTFKGQSVEVHSVVFSPDGRQIASGGGDRTIRLFDSDSGRLIRTFVGHFDGSGAVAFAPDGRRIAATSYNENLRLRELKILDVESGRLIRTITQPSASQVPSVAFSPDGRCIVSASYDNTLILWEADSGQLLRTFTGHSDWVESVAFSLDGRRIVSGSKDQSVALWEADNGRRIRTFGGHSGSVNAVAFLPDGRGILSGSSDKTLKLWDAETGFLIRTFPGHSASVQSVAFAQDGRRVISGAYDNTLRLWEAESGRLIRIFERASPWGRAWAVSPDSRRIAFGGDDTTLRLWQVNGDLQYTLVAISRADWQVIWADGSLSGSRGGLAELMLVRGYEVQPLPDDYKAAFLRNDSQSGVAAGKN